MILPFALVIAERRRIIKLALEQRWPIVATTASAAEDGALMSYGPDVVARHRRAAYYVDRILRGTKPGDIPIEQPTKFELVLNMTTAKVLGLAMPAEIMMRVDRVIQ